MVGATIDRRRPRSPPDKVGRAGEERLRLPELVEAGFLVHLRVFLWSLSGCMMVPTLLALVGYAWISWRQRRG